MSEPDQHVIEQLRARRERPQRQPPTRRPANGQPAPAVVAASGASSADGPPATGSGAPAQQNGRVAAQPSSRRVSLSPEDPLANFAVRVRRPLDDFVAWRLAELRRHGVRVSKAELTELLVWELSGSDVDTLAERVAAFRQAAPRAPR